MKRKSLKGQEKVGVVMKEFKRGTLHSGSGQIVKNPKQAVAIAMHEAGMSKDQMHSRAKGGPVSPPKAMMPMHKPEMDAMMKKSMHGSATFTPSELVKGYRSLGPATDPRAGKQKG